MSEFKVFETAEEVAAAAAEEIAGALRGGSRTLVLAGGTTPRRCYELLVKHEVEWGRVTILFGDERCLPPDDPESNYRMAREALLDHVSPATVHRMPAELGPEEGAAEYSRIVASLAPLDVVVLGIGEDGHTASLFPGHPELLLDHVSPATVHRMPAELGPEEGAAEYSRIVASLAPLDVVVLGIGEDGHTASLFPGHPELQATGWAVGVRNSPKPPPERVSLTLQALRGAGRVLILATGAGKAEAVAKAKRQEVPSGMIAGARWLLDRAAAGG